MTTLWVGATEGVTEADLVDAFYSYGELKAVRLANNCAFVEFADRESAERAADAKYRNLVIKGNSLPLDWARPRGGPSQKRDADEVGLPGVLPGQQAPALRPELAAAFGLEDQQGPAGPPPQKKARRPPHAPYPSMDPNRLGSRPPGRRRRGRRVPGGGGATRFRVFAPRRRRGTVAWTRSCHNNNGPLSISSSSPPPSSGDRPLLSYAFRKSPSTKTRRRRVFVARFASCRQSSFRLRTSKPANSVETSSRSK